MAECAGDLPWTSFELLAAQADSYFLAEQFPLTDVLTFTTQQARGQYYQTKMTKQLATAVSSNCQCSFASTYPVAGQSWWQLYDDPGRLGNWGLATLRDDPYDGVASTPNPGVDEWGYVTGCQGVFALPGPTTPCEQGSYGDALDYMTSADSYWLSYAKR